MKIMPESIDPERARRYLIRNEGNRAIRNTWVQFLANEMREGRFTLTHQGICFDEHGVLIDGQHRLLAIVTSGCTVTMNVCKGAPSETFRYIDTNAKRTTPDRLKLVEDQKDNKTCCQIVTAYIKFAVVRRGGVVPVDDIEDTFLGMTSAFVQVAEAFRVKTPLLIRATVGAAIATYLHVDKVKGTYFLESFVTGADLSASSPILLLRSALQHDRMDTPYDEYWKTISAIKADRAGRPLKVLQAATEDLLGNEYKSLVHERAAISKKGMQTLKERRINLTFSKNGHK